MEKPGIGYLSFVRGFLAATDEHGGIESGRIGEGTAGPPGEGMDPVAFAEGVAAWAALSRAGRVDRYRELSTQDGGRFTGTLDAELVGTTSELPLTGTLDVGQKPC